MHRSLLVQFHTPGNKQTSFRSTKRGLKRTKKIIAKYHLPPSLACKVSEKIGGFLENGAPMTYFSGGKSSTRKARKRSTVQGFQVRLVNMKHALTYLQYLGEVAV